LIVDDSRAAGTRQLQSFSNIVLKIIRALLGAVLIGSVFLIVANAIGRYLLLTPIMWAEEILGYVLVWMVYLGAVLVTWEAGHLRVDLLSRGLRGLSGIFVNGLAAIAFLGVGAVIVYQSLLAIPEFTHSSQVAELPMNLVHTVVPIAFVVIILMVLLRIKTYLAGDSKPDLSSPIESPNGDRK